jgi:hypothetical protein
MSFNLRSVASVTLAALAALAGVVEALPQGVPSTTSTTTTNTGAVSTEVPVVSSISCNNSPDLCSRRYDQVTYLGGHNSAFLRDESTNFSVAGNQHKNVTVALDAGLRLFQAQVHSYAGALRLCHTTCTLLDAGLLQDWLATINAWMDQNPHDVVTILLVNYDNRPTAEFAAAYEGSGLSRHGFVPRSPTATKDWPTLQTMIEQKTRLVSFIANIEPSPAYPYLLNEFDYVFETAFEVTEMTGFNCTLDRPKSIDIGTALDANFLGLVNHFKYEVLYGDIMSPDDANLETVNDPVNDLMGSLARHVDYCVAQWTRAPNFVLVDFWDVGNPLAAADALNGVVRTDGRNQIGTQAEMPSAGISTPPTASLYLSATALVLALLL